MDPDTEGDEPPSGRPNTELKVSLLPKRSLNSPRRNVTDQTGEPSAAKQPGLVWPTPYCAVLQTALSCHLIRFAVSGAPSVSTEGLFSGFIAKFLHRATK